MVLKKNQGLGDLINYSLDIIIRNTSNLGRGHNFSNFLPRKSAAIRFESDDGFSICSTTTKITALGARYGTLPSIRMNISASTRQPPSAPPPFVPLLSS